MDRVVIAGDQMLGSGQLPEQLQGWLWVGGGQVDEDPHRILLGDVLDPLLGEVVVVVLGAGEAAVDGYELVADVRIGGDAGSRHR